MDSNDRDSDSKQPLLEPFDGDDWEGWSFRFRAAVDHLKARGIVDGTEKEPPEVEPANPLSPTKEEKIAVTKFESWHNRNRKGRSLLFLSVKRSIQHTLNDEENLRQNWLRLKAQYGAQTGFTIWSDYKQYFYSQLSDSEPLQPQMDTLNDLRARVINGGVNIPDNMHALQLIGTLPSSYEIVRQSILSTIDFAKADPAAIRQRIISIAKQRNGEIERPSISAIHQIGIQAQDT